MLKFLENQETIKVQFFEPATIFLTRDPRQLDYLLTIEPSTFEPMYDTCAVTILIEIKTYLEPEEAFLQNLATLFLLIILQTC